MKKSLWYSSVVLILVNLFSIIGILFLGWNVKNIIMLFWLETGIIGFFSALKLIFIKNELSGKNISLMTRVIRFAFSFAFLLFIWAILGSVLTSIIGVNPTENEYQFIAYLFSLNFYRSWITLGIGIAVILIFFSHFFSFMINFIKNKEYLNPLEKYSYTNQFFQRQMAINYAVIFLIILYLLNILIHLFLGTKLYSFESYMAFFGALLLILVKGYFDLKAHIKEHNPQEKEKWLDSDTLISELQKFPSKK